MELYQCKTKCNTQNKMRLCDLILGIVCIMISLEMSESLDCSTDLPQGCTCFNSSQVQCDNSGLTNFSSVPPFQSMHFENNDMRTIDIIPYDDTVRFLYLISNNIRTVQDGAFKTMNKLSMLSLSKNQITCLSPLTFKGLLELKSLVLSENPLYYLQTDTIHGSILPQLETLYLDRCRLYDMEIKALDTLSNLTTLSMNYNHLRSIPTLGCAENSLDKLRTWELSHNEINVAPKSNCHMPNLMHLRLSYNNLGRLEANFLGKSIQNIQQLHLDHNVLEYVDTHAFTDCKNLTHLDVSYNKLRGINELAIPWKRVEQVLIHDNPWNCSCGNHWLVDKGNVAKYNNEKVVRCDTPARWHNYSVTAVDKNVFKFCHPKSHAGRVVGIVMGTIFGLIGLFVCFIVIYRIVTRRRPYRSQGQNPPNENVNRNTTSSYKRMGQDNDVTLGGNPEWAEETGYTGHSDPTFTIG